VTSLTAPFLARYRKSDLKIKTVNSSAQDIQPQKVPAN